MKTYDFECGCKFPIINEKIKEIDGLPSIRIDYENLNYRCPSTWSLFIEGKTKGIFQLETNLGCSWSKKVRPVEIEELAALISILRPGCLKGLLDDGRSVAQHFVDRKHLEEDFTYFHDLAEPVLSNSYGLMIYQEQILSIAKLFAGFTLQQADTLRKGIGKKLPEVVAKCRTEFIEGCIKQGTITEGDATSLFDIIEKANRYGFNKSHAVAYGKTGYWCAIPKYHFPLHFFTAWLDFAQQKIKPKVEIAELVQEAKLFNIVVENPNISYKNENFIIDNGKIRYGLGSIKSVGTENVATFLSNIASAEEKLQKSLKDFSWHDTLLYLLSSVRKDVVNNLIHAGALSIYGMHRQEMLYQYNKISELNDKEIEWIINNCHNNNIIDDIEEMLSKKKTVAKRRTKLDNLLISIKNPPTNLVDSIEVITACEEDVLGIALSHHKLDAKNTGYITCTCAEFSSGEKTKDVIIAVQISRVTEWHPKDKPDNKMCFLTGHDKSGKIDIMVPTKEYDKYGFLLFDKNTISIRGSINQKGNLTAKVITQL